MRFFPAGILLALGCASGAADRVVLPPSASLELLWSEGEFTEGPALAPDGTICFSDIGNRILKFDPKTKQVSVFRDPSGRSNGLKFDARGRLVACEGSNTGGNRRISITETSGQVRMLADRWEGKRFNSPNDLAIGPKGQVYFTDPRYVGDDPRDLDFEGVFLVEPDGKVTLATRDVQKPNGIVITPDGGTVYVADNNPKGVLHLLSFRVQADGTLADKRVLYDFKTGRGIDGMALGRDGNLYATAGTGEKAGVYVFSPKGEIRAVIATPGDPTNCCWGADGTTLYITAGAGKKFGLYRIPLKS
jgi:gluconolactonase